MKRFSLLLLLCTLLSSAMGQQQTPSQERPKELGQWVDPFIGTGGFPWMCGFTFPGATVPFGMVRLSPDTALSYVVVSNFHTSGYYYGDNQILGFSHTRLSGTGATDGGHFLVVPTVGPVSQQTRRHGQFARFSHDQEVAFPGYYGVVLPDQQIFAELTATARVGVHRYTFSGERAPHILIDVSNALGKHKSSEGEVKILPQAREIEGTARVFGSFSSRYGGIKAYFVARFDQPFADFGTWQDDDFFPGKTTAAGDEIGVDLRFANNQPQVVEVKLAISYVSIENARANLEAEAQDGNFSEILARTQDTWGKALAAVQIEGGSLQQKTCFYTALYHSLQMPTLFTDVNGDYIGFDKQIHNAAGFDYYTDMSLWDTFRTVHPLLTLIERQRQRDMVKSLVQMGKQGVGLPRWPSGCGYTNSMFGTPADIMIADSYLKGIRDFDVASTYAEMRKVALAAMPAKSPFSGREGIEHYQQYGYCPAELMKEAVARNLEFAYADHAISRLAKALGHDQDAALFAQRAQSYRNLFNPKTQYFQPRDSQGQFVEPFYPLLLTYLDFDGKYTNDFVEGSALHWRWSVPFDAPGLISLFESREYFIAELDKFFARSNPDVGGMIPSSYYWHGNEHDIHAVYLFNSANRPDLTQKWVRWILEHKYSTEPHGIDGNDDAGTISAWYVFSALGFYPIAGSEIYQIGSPLFDKAQIRLDGATFTVIANDNALQNVYIQQAWLNDKPLQRSWLTHDEIAQGGTLRLEMGDQPSQWGTAEDVMVGYK